MENTLIWQPMIIISIIVLYIIVLSREYRIFVRRKAARERLEDVAAKLRHVTRPLPTGRVDDSPSFISITTTKKTRTSKPIQRKRNDKPIKKNS